MIRYLLLFLFFVMFAGGAFGLDVSLAPGLSVKNFFLYILIVMFAIQTAVTKNRKLEALSVLTPFGILLAYCLMSFAVVVLFVNYPNYSVMQGAVQLKAGIIDQFLMLLVFFYGVMKSKDVIWLIRMVVWLVMFGNVLTLVDAFGLPDLAILEIHYSGRIQGFIGQPNDYGAFLAFFLPATIALFISEIGFRRVMAGFGVIATFICLLLTFSRGSWVGVILGAVVAAVFLRKYVAARTVTIAVTSAIGACAVTVPLLFLTDFGEIFAERLSLLSGDADTVSQGRSTLWLRALSVMMEHPQTFITGYGWNAYGSFREFRLITHNTYLHHLFNIGTIGLTLFVTLLLGVLAELRRAAGAMSGIDRSFVVSAIFGFSALCVCMFFSEIFHGGLLIWAYIGLVLRLTITSVADGSNRGSQAGAHFHLGRV